jgi:nucleoid-associated protein YgaU
MYRAKGGWFMTRSQVIALLLGAGVVAIGAGLAWRGVVPGFSPTEMAPGMPNSASAPTSEEAKTSPPATKPAVPGQAQQEAATEPNGALPQAEPPPAQPLQTTAPDIPVFDTVRVEPSGDTVVAGHGTPEAKIALMAGDKVIAEVDADGAGNFVMVPPPLAPGDYLLALRSTGKNAATIDSHQNITVSVPPKGQKNVVVALAEPGKPSVILTDTAKPEPPAASPARAAPAQPEVAFKTAEVDNGGFYASGTATPGADLRIYLNGTNLAEVTAGSDGHWSLTVGKGVAPGRYAVRADVLDESGKVLARAEVPFDVPVSVAEADAPAAKPAQTATPAAPPQSAPPPGAPAPQMSASSQPAPSQSTGAPETSAAEAPAPGAPPPQTSASSEPAPSQSAGAPETSAAAPASAGRPAKQSGNEEVAATPSLPTPNAHDAVVPQIETTTVARGDSLWRISRKVFGHGIRYTLIYEANADQIRDPSLIYPGQIFVLPHAATN